MFFNRSIALSSCINYFFPVRFLSDFVRFLNQIPNIINQSDRTKQRNLVGQSMESDFFYVPILICSLRSRYFVFFGSLLLTYQIITHIFTARLSLDVGFVCVVSTFMVLRCFVWCLTQQIGEVFVWQLLPHNFCPAKCRRNSIVSSVRSHAAAILVHGMLP